MLRFNQIIKHGLYLNPNFKNWGGGDITGGRPDESKVCLKSKCKEKKKGIDKDQKTMSWSCLWFSGLKKHGNVKLYSAMHLWGNFWNLMEEKWNSISYVFRAHYLIQIMYLYLFPSLVCIHSHSPYLHVLASINSFIKFNKELKAQNLKTFVLYLLNTKWLELLYSNYTSIDNKCKVETDFKVVRNACQSNNVFRQSVPNTMEHNYKGAMNINLNPWLLTGNASLRINGEWLNPGALKIISSILKSILNSPGGQWGKDWHDNCQFA